MKQVNGISGWQIQEYFDDNILKISQLRFSKKEFR